MSVSRRDFLHRAAGSLLATGVIAPQAVFGGEKQEAPPIVDTHQHLWDLERFRLPWLQNSPAVLRQSYMTREYLDATRGLNVVQAVYMEVDVAPDQHVAEAEHVLALSREADHPTAAAVIGGRPASPDFATYLARFKGAPHLKGVRQVLHAPDTSPGTCLEPEFVRGIRLLGRLGLSFDLCMRPAELKDGIQLADLCPDTRFVVDHCGNADPQAFANRGDSDWQRPAHDPETWKRDMEQFARRRNVICKISGIVARVRPNWSAGDLAPIVNHCLDVFGPERVVFGGDWPVCLLGASFHQWVEALREIVSVRPLIEQRKLWHDNAVRFYSLNGD